MYRWFSDLIKSFADGPHYEGVHFIMGNFVLPCELTMTTSGGGNVDDCDDDKKRTDHGARFAPHRNDC